jgi:hypothetical protein
MNRFAGAQLRQEIAIVVRRLDLVVEQAGANDVACGLGRAERRIEAGEDRVVALRPDQEDALARALGHLQRASRLPTS